MSSISFRPTVLLTLLAIVVPCSVIYGQESSKPMRVGIIGLDTSHSIAFTKLMNLSDGSGQHNCRVVCAFPHGSADIESSVSRIPKYTEQIKAMDVEIVASIETLISKVDAVLLETNDGRLHLEQALPVLKSRIPVFVDKPAAASLEDVIALFKAATHFGTPLFSSSSLRFAKPALKARQGALVGKVLGCTTFSPATLEPTHPDLYWYGIHGVEQLFTVMGPGCESVTRINSDATDVVVGTWNDGRVGTFRGMRSGPHSYGGTVFGTKGQASTGGNEGYEGLLNEIKIFFATRKPPVDAEETIEIFAFMSASDESKNNGGAPVRLNKVIESATIQADARLRKLGIKLP